MKSINQSINSVRTFTRLSSVMVVGIALLTCEQANATIYTSLTNITSANDFTDGNKWAISFCNASAVGGTITPQSGDYFVICNSLTFPTNYIINFTRLTFNTTGTWNGGVLKFGAGNKDIRNLNSSLSSIDLDVSNMDTGNTLTIVSPGSPVTFSNIAGGSLSCATSYPATISAGTMCTATVPAPAAPTGLTATAVSQTQINLSWTDNSNNETGFKVESPAGTLTTTTAANTTGYSYTGLTCNTNYTFAVKATHSANGDSSSITANATTSACTGGGSGAVSAPIDFSFNHKQPETFATEIQLK